MSELEKMPPAAEMRYDGEDIPFVARVLVRVEFGDGLIREFEAAEPEDFQMNDPENDLSFRPMGRAVQAAGSPWVPMMAAVPSLRLSFRANPRFNMHIRTERTAPPSGWNAATRVEDEHRTVRLGKDAITGGGDAEVDVRPALPEAGVDLTEETPGLI